MLVVRRIVVIKKKIDFQFFVLKESIGFQRLLLFYLLELIVIVVWEKVGKFENFDLCKGFYYVLREIVDYRCLKYVWILNYDFYYVQR